MKIEKVEVTLCIDPRIGSIAASALKSYFPFIAESFMPAGEKEPTKDFAEKTAAIIEVLDELEIQCLLKIGLPAAVRNMMKAAKEEYDKEHSAKAARQAIRAEQAKRQRAAKKAEKAAAAATEKVAATEKAEKTSAEKAETEK